MEITIKRIYDYQKISISNDGYVIYTDRMYPRGIKKTDPRISRWIKGIAPSSELINWYHVDTKTRWSEFRKKYLVELREIYKKTETKKKLNSIASHNKITILYSSRDEEHNNAIILSQFLRKIKKTKSKSKTSGKILSKTSRKTLSKTSRKTLIKTLDKKLVRSRSKSKSVHQKSKENTKSRKQNK